MPVELLSYGLAATLRALEPTDIRDVPLSPDGGVIADYRGPVGDPAALAARLSSTPGVVDHGLFEPALTAEILIARGEEVERRAVSRLTTARQTGETGLEPATPGFGDRCSAS